MKKGNLGEVIVITRGTVDKQSTDDYVDMPSAVPYKQISLTSETCSVLSANTTTSGMDPESGPSS